MELALGLLMRPRRSLSRLPDRLILSPPLPRLRDSFFRKLPLVTPSTSRSKTLGWLLRRVPQVADREMMESLSRQSLSNLSIAAWDDCG